MDASKIVSELIEQESLFKRKKVLDKWQEENKELYDLFIESCVLAYRHDIPFVRLVDKFTADVNAPPGSYSTIKRFVDERIREEESRRNTSGN